MCGICGVFDYVHRKPVAPRLIEDMCAAMRHRGPDGTGTFEREGLCLGHVRLSIIDLVSWLYTGLVVQMSGGDDPFADAAPDWVERITETLEGVRTNDGGYAKTTEGAAGSTYHSFLVALTYELL